MRSGLSWCLALWFVLSVGMSNSSLAEGLDCSKHDDAKASFMPRAFTLASMTVRSKAPDYSLSKRAVGHGRRDRHVVAKNLPAYPESAGDRRDSDLVFGSV